MKRYIGMVKKVKQGMSGVQIKILVRFSDSESYLREWTGLYNNSESFILENNEELEKFFRDFEDFAPVTEEERKYALKLYEELMKDD